MHRVQHCTFKLPINASKSAIRLLLKFERDQIIIEQLLNSKNLCKLFLFYEDG